MALVSVSLCCVTNNHTTPVTSNNKHLFFTHLQGSTLLRWVDLGGCACLSWADSCLWVCQCSRAGLTGSLYTVLYVCHYSLGRSISPNVQVHFKPQLASHFLNILLAKENHMAETKVQSLRKSPAHSERMLKNFMARSMNVENDEELDQMIAIYPKTQMEVKRRL